jgi:hypothetical protein
MPVLGLFVGACSAEADRTLGKAGDLPGVNALAVQEDLNLVVALDGHVDAHNSKYRRNPTFGEFFVADSKPKRKSAPRVVLDVSGGVLQEAFCNDPRTKLIKVDWDTDGCDPTDAGIVEITDQNGRCRFVSVVEYPALPPARLAGTDVLAALSAAGFEDKGRRS